MRARRLRALHERLMEEDLDALVVSARSSVRWLTGFTGSAGAVWVPREEEAVLVTDGRYGEQATEQTGGMPVVLDRTWEWLAARSRRGLRIGVEADVITWATARQIAELLQDSDPVATVGLVATLRQRKDDVEIAALRRACDITTEVFRTALEWLEPGMTERAVARRLVDEMIDRGADGPAFAPIVARGVNGSRPHHEPGDQVVAAGELVTMDFGALVDGYHADMTRTVALADPGVDLRTIHELVRRAQDAGVAALRDGVAAREVDAACREPITAAGHGEEFRHGTGHGVGLDIHEAPFLAATAAGTLQEAMTVTVEPGIYIPGLGGVRIEDVVLVTDTGGERLTTAPRDLIIL